MPSPLASPNRLVALVSGTGHVGYAVVATATGRPLLAALIGVAGGALLATALLGITHARVANVAVGTAWLVLGYAGLFLVGTAFNAIPLGALVEVGLFAAAVVHLAVGLGARRDRSPDPTPGTPAP